MIGAVNAPTATAADIMADCIRRAVNGEHLTMADMRAAVEAIVDGEATPAQIGALLAALATRGETADELAGAADALRERMLAVHCTRAPLLDVCGTGGDGSGTFNISTAAALVVAAAGVPVAKHGNRGITSKTGSADALAALGVNVHASVERVERCLDQLGICFCFAPLLHPSMKKVAQVRKKLGVPTIFNLLGPLSNPAAAPFQVVGVGRPELRPLLAEALLLLGTTRAVVVQGEDGLDEVTLAGPTRVTEVAGGGLRNFSWTPADFGFSPASLDSLAVENPQQSAAMIREILQGTQGSPRDIVVLNAAAALWTAGLANTPSACAKLAAAAIESGAAGELLKRLVQVSNE